MARRSRRRRSSPSKANPRSYSGLRARGEHEQESISSAQSSVEPVVSDHAAQPAPASKGPSQADWKTEYSRVFSDLKQLLIVSVALFALMLVVGFFL
jgi:hypothetical protein